MLRRRLAVLFACLGLTHQVWAQTAPVGGGSASGSLLGAQSLIPPAPTTASLGNYGALPVDLNAGAVTVNVPLGEVHCRSLTVPVSLSYRTTGVRVEEVASWAGLGWDLNPGGLITRTVRGMPDEHPYGYFATFQQWRMADSAYYASPTTASKTAKLRADQGAVNGLIDTEADTYTLSLPGYSATMRFDSHRNLHLNPAKNWTVNGAPDGVWKAISPEGVVYAFEAVETTELDDPSGLTPGGTPAFYSAWHLTSITSANGKDQILFDYVPNVSGTAQVVPINRVSRAKLYLLPNDPQNNSAYYCAQDQPFSDGNVYTSVRYSTLSLSRIRTATTSVLFNSNFDRLDLSPTADAPGRRLTSVVFADVRNPAVTRRFDFTYGPCSGIYDRLRLDTVQQVGQPPYIFHYNESGQLPTRDSNAQDHWGFYNGQANSSLIPAPPASVANGRTDAISVLATANRSTNAQTMQVGVLESVRYPTGGSTYFTYEANRIGSVTSSVDDSITTFTAAASGLHGTQLDPVSQAVYDRLFVPNSYPGEPSVGAKVFALPRGASNVQFSPPYYRPGVPGQSYQVFYELWRLDDSNPDPGSYSSGTQIYPSPGGGRALPSTLPAGTYLLFAATTEISDNATIEVKMHVETGPRYRERLVGGLRIRRMVDYAQSGDSLVSSYDYTRYDSTAQRRISTGTLYNDPQYIRFTACGGAIITAMDARTMSYLQEGYHLSYGQVSVTRRGSADGQTTYQYFDNVDPNFRNLVLHETITDGIGRVLKQVDNAYYYERTDVVPVTKVLFKQNLVYVCSTQNNPTPYYCVFGEEYETTTDSYFCYQEALLQSTKEQLFTSQSAGKGRLVHQAVRTYTYPRLPSGHLFGSPSWVRDYLASGEQLATHTTYARDYAASAPADKPLVGLVELRAHRVQTAVVETQQWRHHGSDSVLIGGTLSHYQALQPWRSWRLVVAAPLSSSTFTSAHVQNQHFIQDARYVETATYDRYTRHGNLAANHYHSSYSSYLWDERGTHLLASVKQARVQQIGYTSFEPASSGRWTYDTTSVKAVGLTGRQSYVWGSTPVALDSLPAGLYTLTLWATSTPDLQMNGVSVPAPVSSALGVSKGSQPFQNYRYQLALSAPLTMLSLTGRAGELIDEVRLHPTGAQMQSYTYEPLHGMTSQTDPTGRTTTYEYDGLGRLIRTRDEQNRILSQQQYHYAGK
jgi:YD repeat-containing protein